ncbi:restriction endonuclease subunit S [Chryseobacterium culicis]|nr:restriction endonuclease subunit S [Chryseobacterium culicis]
MGNFPTGGYFEIPRLRFPEFTGVWENKRLGELLEFKNGINASKEQYGSGIKFINVLDILSNDFITYDNIVGKVNVDELIVEKFSVSYGDILFQRSSETREEVGTANVYLDKNKNATFGGFVIRGKKIGEYNPVFFNKLLKTNSARENITSKSGGSTRFNVGQEILSSVNLYFPNLPEQDKIASFLLFVDERIQTQKKIIEQLETLMKGVSYKLFNRKIRFKNNELSEFPSWENKKGNEVFSNISNKNHNSDLPILAITQEYGAIPRDLIDFQISVTDKSVESYKVVEKGDFIISLRSFQGGIEYSEYKGICSPAYIILRNKIEVNSYFYKYYFKSESYIKQLNKKLEGIRDGKMISYAYFSDINLPLPSLNEQTKIVNFLSSIQEKIETEKQILEKLELQKKFLLANLFV